jgi:hypothetical protein
MKIVAFAQLHNELEKGNLHNWFKSVQEFCDYIYIFDQASTDGSREVYEQHANTVVIYSPTNRFHEELICKQELLHKVLQEQPDADWIFWMDGDTVTSSEFTREAVEHELANSTVDQLNLGHYNLWRSDKYYRVDNKFHNLHLKVPAFWRVRPDMCFPSTAGLHKPQAPHNLIGMAGSYLKLLHRGFATDYSIRSKYAAYRDLGQPGIHRLISENGLSVRALDDSLIPSWLDADKSSPVDKKRLSKISDVCVSGMVYKCPQYYEFIVDQLHRYAKAEHYPVKTRLVANDPTPAIEELIRKETRIDIVDVYNDPEPQDFYLNRVYRCWNYIGRTCPASAVVFVNSDMAFSPGWLDALLEAWESDNIPCSKLVESGKMSSGKYAISEDFGKTPHEYREDAFIKYAEDISEEGRTSPGGLYMPCVFAKEDFIALGGYPEGNIYKGGAGATHTKFVRSGDVDFFNRSGKQHVTVFDSIVYHIQEGEKDA